MLLAICAIYDTKAQNFQPPFFARNKDVAIRWFESLLMDQNSDVAKFPMDYSIVYLGHFDDATAKFDIVQTPEVLAHGLTFKPRNHAN